jgi:hypothetical protein
LVIKNISFCCCNKFYSQQRKIKKLPAGIALFDTILDEEYFFIDNTHLLLPLWNRTEQSLLIVAPRRMGKSTWVSMIETFFSKHFTRDRKHLFKQLSIG